MKKTAFAIVLAAGFAAPVLAQPAFEYQFVPLAGTPGMTVGDGFETTASSVSFWFQARARNAVGANNFGIVRVGNGFTPSSLSLTGPATIARGNANLSGTRRGRTTGLRFTGTSGGDFELAAANAPAQINPNANQGNENGFWTPTVINRWDAYQGFQRASLFDADDNYVNPYGTPITNGAFTEWLNIYAVTVNFTAFGTSTVTGFAWGNLGRTTTIVGSNTIIDLLVAPVSSTASIRVTQIPAPGAAALLGLGVLAAGRRRR